MLRLLLASVFALSPFAASPAAAQEWARGEPIEEPTELPAEPEDFVTVEGTFLRVHGPESQTELLLRIARHGSEALPALATRLQVPIGNTVHVYVARDEAEFEALQPGRFPEWADATAWPKAGVVFLRAPAARGGMARPLEQVFDHELTHVLVGRAFGDREPPTWLTEGIARLMAREVTPDEAETLVRARGDGSWIPLNTLADGFPSDGLRARLAYAESGDFVAWLEETYGPSVIPELLRQSARGAGLNEAVYHATGDLLHEVEAEWTSSHVAPGNAALATLFREEWLWGAGAAAMVVGGLRRRRRFHERLKEMEREEAEVDALVASMRAARAYATH